jgi:RHS repeat-associated protein
VERGATAPLGGNPLTRSDARQQSAQTRYDALDRPIQIDYSDGRQTRYVWDLGQNGIGRLGLIEDYANGTLVSRLAYAYDPQGRLVRQVQTVGASSQSVASTYTDGRLGALTLPSGRTLAYRHDAAGRIADITLATPGLPLVQNAAHTADGRLQRWTDAAGKVQTRSHNLDGQVVAYSAGGQTWQLSYDSAGRLTRIADGANAALAADYSYDALNRITRAVLPNTAYSYAYDANGNRKQSTIGGQVQTLSIDPASNRLLALASSPPIAYTYDPAGNRSTDGQTNYTYDAAGRLVQATSAIGTTRYQVNALNQRTRKTGPLGETTYLHDRQGHLLAETDNQGRIQREYVWLDDQLLAILDGEPSATQVYAVHPDPLGTPRAVTDPTGKLLWRAAPASEPFGLSVEQDPDGDGTPFVLNLRFPGQYYDQETNLAYNWHRYYDERVGSYTTSDPIGLNGGQWSTYGYVDGNPLKYSDPQGLVKWSGEVYSAALIPGVGGAAYWFDLKSECVNGRYAYIRVEAGGFGAGFGARLTGGGSGVTFDDGLSDIFPDGFTGIFRVLGANAGIGLVGGWTWYQVGNNFSDIGWAPSPALGFDLSIAGVMGNSKVVSVDWRRCNCE